MLQTFPSYLGPNIKCYFKKRIFRPDIYQRPKILLPWWYGKLTSKFLYMGISTWALAEQKIFYWTVLFYIWFKNKIFFVFNFFSVFFPTFSSILFQTFRLFQFFLCFLACINFVEPFLCFFYFQFFSDFQFFNTFFLKYFGPFCHWFLNPKFLPFDTLV